MEIKTVRKMQKEAIKSSSLDFIRLGLGLSFMVAVLLFSFIKSGGVPNNVFLAIAALFGAYMAMNIGANDVANNVGPAVGSKALTMGGAIIIAAIFEASGALIAGGDVVETIKNGIIDIHAFQDDTESFIWAMMAALLSAALWLNVATYFKAPVSTTHSIVGGVMGAGIAAAGFSIVSWGTLGKIALSWVISPILGGVIAALFLISIKQTMVYKKDKVKAATVWVPIYIALMSWAFTTYLTLKGLKKVWIKIVDVLTFLPHDTKPSLLIASIIGLIVASIIFVSVSQIVKQNSQNIENSVNGINKLFTIPLIFAAALLSFAHGANDVANAIGPLAAINDAVLSGGIVSQSGIPIWVMAVGAIGIAIGLGLYGPKLIKTVGGEITDLDQMRAFSVAMAAAITVILASGLGLPVSSTHIAIGGIFGVGFLREYLKEYVIEHINKKRKEMEILKQTLKAHEQELNKLEIKNSKEKEDYKRIVELYKLIEQVEIKTKETKKELKNAKQVKYVQRDTVKKIAAAWVITVPVAAILSSAVYFMLRGIFL